MKKQTLSTLASLGLLAGLLSVYPSVAGAADSVKLMVDDKEVSTGASAPFFVGDRVFVPVRTLTEALGATVTYDSGTDSAVITKGDIMLKLDFQSGKVWKNGTLLTLDEQPRLVNYRAMVPVRFISETFGNAVTYDDVTQTVTVLPTQARLDERKSIQDLLKKSSQALQAKKSYTTDFTMKVTVPTESHGTFTMAPFLNSLQLKVDTQAQSKLQHVTGSVEESIGHVKGTMDFELYRQDDTFYGLNPLSDNQWFKLMNAEDDEGVWEGIRDAVNAVVMSPEQLQQFADLAPYATLKQDAAANTVTYHLDPNGICKLLNTKRIDKEVQSFDLTLQFDKTSGLETGYTADVHFDNSIPNPYITLPTSFHAEGKLSNWDKVQAIAIPNDVLKNAVSAK
ncbi:copper amine oxidase N-terminal domain-containing protein [Tumebacillus flagellatus]|uniref:Copper amine oxidase-like N-terminal domain-containing protein n=1 Tax=Tumebacillus flagellatus TaxID=1157490 RepID=A0A074M6R2_9BACL|nr:copper amine oxidase N-terminal domain-containing protein [Tumebacillus flagellatus]KEO81677.1 hypothetical protein EL26_19595 [Tumebacillus flagellatus]